MTQRAHAIAAARAAALAFAACSAHAQPAACIWPAPEPCLYQPAATYNTASVDFTLQDPSRNNHPVPIRVRYPLGVGPGPRPVVLWNHGGSTNPTGHHSSVERGESFASAGYIVIHIARVDVVNPSAQDLAACVAGGVMPTVGTGGTPLANCRTWLGWHVYGPQNNAFVAAVLPQYQIGMLPGFVGTPDRNKIVVGGWSGGTEPVLNIAGASQKFLLHPVPATNVPGVVAFIADSPRGAEYAGYASGLGEDAFYDIDARPFLIFSGRGDETGEPAEARTAAWLGSSPGSKYLSWDTKQEAVHGTMDINECSTALRALHCRWMKALGQAYIDAVVGQRPEAIAWLASDGYRTLTGGHIELHRR